MKTVSLYLANTERVHNLVKECGVSVQFNTGKPSVVTGSEMCVIDFINEYFRGKPIARHFIQEMRDVQQDYEFYPEICERYETILSSLFTPCHILRHCPCTDRSDRRYPAPGDGRHPSD